MRANSVGISDPQEPGGAKVHSWLWRVPCSSAQTRASQSSWGMQSGVDLLFIEIIVSDDHLSDVKIVLFFSLVPLWVLYLPDLTLLLCAELGQADVGGSCSEVVTTETRLEIESASLKVQQHSCFTMLLQPWSFFRSCIHQPQTAVHFLVVSAKKNLMIRMKAIHENLLKIKSHSEIPVKQSLCDIFVYHQLEPSREHVICCFVRLASCCRSYIHFWPLGSFNMLVLEKKTLWHSLFVCPSTYFQELNEN